jgi:hypothetical protein
VDIEEGVMTVVAQPLNTVRVKVSLDEVNVETLPVTFKEYIPTLLIAVVYTCIAELTKLTTDESAVVPLEFVNTYVIAGQGDAD